MCFTTGLHFFLRIRIRILFADLERDQGEQNQCRSGSTAREIGIFLQTIVKITVMDPDPHGSLLIWLFGIRNRIGNAVQDSEEQIGAH